MDRTRSQRDTLGRVIQSGSDDAVARTRLADVPIPRLPSNLDTPALIIDLDRVEANAQRVMDALAGPSVRLRPHIKTHKSLALGAIQLERGASGLTVGNLGEAEVFAAGDVTDIFVAYPVWVDGPKAKRLRALHEAIHLSVGVDSAESAVQLAKAVAGSAKPLRVLVEVDSGDHRTGVADPREALAVAEAARNHGLNVIGVFTHGGHGYAGPGARGPAAHDEARTLGAAADALRSAGFEISVVSTGSTPTMLESARGQVNEIRPGTYLLGDRLQVALGSIPADSIAVHVAATVVSVRPGYVVVDAGAKSLTKDVHPILRGHGYLPAYPDAVIERVADYHGVVRLPPGSPQPVLGEVVAIVPNHVCPVVDLFDSFTAVRGGEVVGVMPVDARGRRG
jgi:D-serine deaminase-like pyridoxal phosphate-dependent protein